MNLYDLKKELKGKYARIKLLKEKVILLKTKTEPGAVKFGNEITSKIITDKTKIIDKIIELEEEIEILHEEIHLYNPFLNELESLLKEYNDLYQLIYFEFYIKGYSADKIGMRHGYSRRQVYNIINKINMELKEETLHKIAQ